MNKKLAGDENILLSACMMVKNEEEMLPECLESIRDLVDEIILVDTGSTDSTVKIAESYGAKIYHHPWENDFSKHRNQSISYASGEWFLIIDADERIKRSTLDPEKLRDILKNKVADDVTAMLTTVVDMKMDGMENSRFKSKRIFRNGVGVRYEGYVHNAPVNPGKEANTNLEIMHYGYDLSEEKMVAKFKRTSSLLHKRIEENPDDFEAYFYLANSYGGGKMHHYEKAIEYAKKSLALMPNDLPNKSVYNSVYYTLASCYHKLDDTESAKFWAKKGLETSEENLGLLFLITKLSTLQKEFKDVRHYASLFLKHFEDTTTDPIRLGGQFLFNTDTKNRDGILFWLLNANIALGILDDFEELWEEVLPVVLADEENKDGLIQILNNLRVGDYKKLLLDKTIEVLQIEPEYYKPLHVLAGYIDDNPGDAAFIRDVKSSLLQLPNTGEYITVVVSSLIGRRQNGAILTMFSDVQISADTDKNILKLLTAVYYEMGDFRKMEKPLDILMQSITSFQELDCITLLLAGQYFLANEMQSEILDIAEFLEGKLPINYDEVIENPIDLSNYFAFLGNHFYQSNQLQEMQLSYEIAYGLSNDPGFIESIGNRYYENQRYHKSIQYYNQLLTLNHQDMNYLVRMRESFRELGDGDGVEKCEQLMQKVA